MPNVAGKWVNQRGSKLHLKQSNGIVEGTFDSGVGDDGETLKVDVQGRVLDDILTFNVVYAKYKTIATWVGQLTDVGGTEILETTWLHVTNVDESEEKDWIWSSVRTGSDTFRRDT